jgi:hypothetical protein
MARRWQRSAGGAAANPMSRLVSMIMMLVVLGLMYTRAKDPNTWRWLADDSPAETTATAPRAVAANDPTAPGDSQNERAEPKTETVVAGPTDQDPRELDEAGEQFLAVSDKAPMAPSEMPAYWRLMRWARAQTFAQLESRAARDPIYTRLWEQPEKHRGKLFRLRLHIKRVLEHPAPKNSAGVTTMYEAWGWTDESKSYPYVVLFSELPPGMKTGDDLHEEGVFCGYLLKTLSYVAFDKMLASPMLLGRMERVAKPGQRGGGKPGGEWTMTLAAGAALVLLVGAGALARMLWRRPRVVAAGALPDMAIEDWLQQNESSESVDHFPPPDPPTDFQPR